MTLAAARPWAAVTLIAAAAAAQRPMLETFSTDDGLPSAIVYDLDQDPSGRLWILSRSGVSVYDGREFRMVSEGLPAEPLAALAAGRDGRAWTVTFEQPRLFVFEGSAWHALPPPPFEHRPADVATSMAVWDRPGGPGVAVGTLASGVLLWTGDGWRRFAAAEGLASDQASDLAVAGDGLVVATSDGPCTISSALAVDCRLRAADPRLSTQILALRPDPEAPDRLWLLTASWMGRLEGARLTVVADGFALLHHDVSIFGDLELDASGGIYFGAPSALYYWDPTSERHRLLDRRAGLSTVGVSALLRDRESNLWVGSLRGLARIASQRFATYDEAYGLLQAEVTAVLERAPGKLVLGHPTGLSFIDGDRVETLALDPQGAAHSSGSKTFRILDLALDAGGDLWLAGQDFGLLRVAPDRTWTVAAAGTFFSVEVDAEGTVWTAEQHRLLAGGATGLSPVPVPAELGELGFFRWLRFGPEGRLYLATRRGLAWRQDGAWQRAESATEEATNVYNVLAEADGSVWVATAVGLYRLQDRQLVKVDRDGLRVDRPIYFLLRDPRGWLWMGTDGGVEVWDGARLRHFDRRHGLAGRETNRGAGLVDDRGQVWIGTEQGVSIYRQRYDHGPAAPPTVEVRAIELDGRLYPPGENLSLRHDQNAVVFYLGTVNFSPEEQVLLRYRLDGFDGDWQGPYPLTSSEIRYTNLPPGSYRFHAEAGWGEGPWSAEATSGAITIARPYWRRTWFYLAAAAVVGVTLSAVHSLRVRSINRHNRRLQQEVAERRRAEAERGLLIDDLQTKNRELERFTYTVSHDLKTPLVTIQGFLGLLEKDAAAGDLERMRRDLGHIRGAASKMGTLLDELLELSRIGRMRYGTETVALAEIAREAVELTAARIAARDVEVEIADDLPAVAGERVRLLEVMLNLIDNAVKFLGDQPEPKVEIGVRRDAGGDATGGGPVVFVRDNGKGIDPRYHGKVFGLFERLDYEQEGTGIGLAIVQRIVELHGGRIWVESEGDGRGATFCFTLPGGAHGG